MEIASNKLNSFFAFFNVNILKAEMRKYFYHIVNFSNVLFVNWTHFGVYLTYFCFYFYCYSLSLFLFNIKVGLELLCEQITNLLPYPRLLHNQPIAPGINPQPCLNIYSVFHLKVQLLYLEQEQIGLIYL